MGCWEECAGHWDMTVRGPDGCLIRLLVPASGLRQAMATAGALVGASIAGLAYKLSGQNYTLTFAMATIPACVALVLTISVGKGISKPPACMHVCSRD